MATPWSIASFGRLIFSSFLPQWDLFRTPFFKRAYEDKELFGTDRMLEVLNRNRDAGSKELLVRVKEEIDAFAGDVPQFDDTTMLGFRYNGTDQGTEA